MRKSIIVSRRLALFLVCAFMSVAQAMADDVATIGSTGYATLSAALSAATSGQTITITATTCVLDADATLNSGVTLDVPSGKTLLIPYSSSNTSIVTGPSTSETWSTGKAHVTLTMDANANIIVEGNVCLGGQQYSTTNQMRPTGQGGPGAIVGDYGCINMSKGGKITLKSGSNLYAWGFIVGQNDGNNTANVGTIVAEAGATVHENLVIGDWHGGGVTAAMTQPTLTGVYKWIASYSGDKSLYKVFPLTQYFVPNIEIPLTFEYGASETVRTYMSSSFGVNGDVDVPYIGKNGCFFNMTSDGSKVTKRYDPLTDEQCYEAWGDVEINALSISSSGATINSADYVLPLTNTMNFKFHNGELTLPNDVELLPGTKILLDKDVTANVKGNLYVYDVDDWEQYAYGYHVESYDYRPTSHDKRTWTDNSSLADAQIIVNGKLSVSGFLYTTNGGANICSTEDGGQITFVKTPTASGNIYQVLNNGENKTNYGPLGLKVSFGNKNYSVYLTQIPVTAPQLKNNDADGSYTSTAGVTAGTTFYNEDGKWYKETVALKQEQDVTSIQNDWKAADTEYKKYTLSRTFYKGWNSVMLPFATTRAKLGADEAIEFTGAPVNDGENTVTLQFKGVESLEANKPYMLYYASDPGEKTYSFVEKRTAPQTDNKVTVTQDQFQFIGSYVYYDKGNTFIQSGDYLVSEDGFSKTTVGGNRLYAYRAFFHPTEATSAKLNFTVDGDEVTGIRAIQLEDALRGENTVGNGRLYNLSGQRVDSSYKGIVVKNGKKMLLK